MIGTFWDVFDPTVLGGVAVLVIVAMFGLLWRKIDKHVVEPVREIPVIRATQLATSADVKLIKAELFPNGGGSMRDSVNRNEDVTNATSEAVTALDGKLEDHIVADTMVWEKIDVALGQVASGQVAAADAAVATATALSDTTAEVAAGVASVAILTAADLAHTAEDATHAAEVEVEAQAKERKRVQDRDAQWDK